MKILIPPSEGKSKIKSYLINKGISENEITQGLESIDNEIYFIGCNGNWLINVAFNTSFSTAKK